MYRVGQKVIRKFLFTSSPNRSIDDFQNFFATTFCGKFVIKWLLNITLHYIKCVATDTATLYVHTTISFSSESDIAGPGRPNPEFTALKHNIAHSLCDFE